MNMVFCRGCGKEIHETAPTCPHCGAPQRAVNMASALQVGNDGFFDLGLQPFRKFAEFAGRARRKEYWFFFLITLIIYTVMSLISPVIYGITCLVLLLPSLAVGVRRLHDTDRSGWWIIVPIVNLVFLCLDSQLGQNRFGASPKYA